ncbi:uncharacterized protein LOC111937891 [Cyanistes caeruleus]|uniref:uncharacterized protein LOC111937891 n=1 Tax=Cyanistes caeruleus TaxID=156563 RepID=UPI000CDB3728|nr:uncharacterized protein LOC111937891 [Cyanistes caeruleus]XP_023795214.1 uncharacterized protein LOC111937891 [Cyanistes caeruleus]
MPPGKPQGLQDSSSLQTLHVTQVNTSTKPRLGSCLWTRFPFCQLRGFSSSKCFPLKWVRNKKCNRKVWITMELVQTKTQGLHMPNPFTVQVSQSPFHSSLGWPQSQQLSTAPAPEHCSTSACFHPWGCAPPKTVSRVSPSLLPDFFGQEHISAPQSSPWLPTAARGSAASCRRTVGSRARLAQGWDIQTQVVGQGTPALLAGRRCSQVPLPSRHSSLGHSQASAEPPCISQRPSCAAPRQQLPGDARALCCTFPARCSPGTFASACHRRGQLSPACAARAPAPPLPHSAVPAGALQPLRRIHGYHRNQ